MGHAGFSSVEEYTPTIFFTLSPCTLSSLAPFCWKKHTHKKRTTPKKKRTKSSLYQNSLQNPISTSPRAEARPETLSTMQHLSEQKYL